MEAPAPDAGAIEWALFYASLRWPVLQIHTLRADGRCSCGHYDCRSPGKHPIITHGFKDASIEPQQIRTWWERWPDANIGIATGALSGLVVVDIDPRNGGDESYAKLQQELPGAFTELKRRQDVIRPLLLPQRR